MYIATQIGDEYMVHVLLEMKADANDARHNGATALSVASHGAHADVVKTLLESDAYPNSPVDDGGTPLIVAAQNGHVLVVVVGLIVNARV